jgi:hypothetical protein
MSSMLADLPWRWPVSLFELPHSGTLRRRVTALIATVALLLAALGTAAAITAADSNRHIDVILKKTARCAPPVRAQHRGGRPETGIRATRSAAPHRTSGPTARGVAAERDLIARSTSSPAAENTGIRAARWGRRVGSAPDAWRAAVAEPVRSPPCAPRDRRPGRRWWGRRPPRSSTGCGRPSTRLQDESSRCASDPPPAAATHRHTLVAIEIAAAAIIVLAGAAAAPSARPECQQARREPGRAGP